MSSPTEKKGPSGKKKIIAAVIVLVLLSLAGGCLWTVRRGMDRMQTLLTDTAESAEVRRGEIRSTVHGSGSLAVADVAEVRAPSGIEVEEVFFESGDTVKKGDILARFNDRSILQALIRIESDLKTIDDTEKKDEELSAYRKEELKIERADLQRYQEELEQLRKDPVIRSDAAGVIDQFYLTEGEVTAGQNGAVPSSGGTDAGSLSQIMQNFSSAGLVSADMEIPSGVTAAAQVTDEIPQGVLLSAETEIEEYASGTEGEFPDPGMTGEGTEDVGEVPPPDIAAQPPVPEEEFPADDADILQAGQMRAADAAPLPGEGGDAIVPQDEDDGASGTGTENGSDEDFEKAAGGNAGGGDAQDTEQKTGDSPPDVDEEALLQAGDGFGAGDLGVPDATDGGTDDSGQAGDSLFDDLSSLLEENIDREIPSELILEVISRLASSPLTAGDLPVTDLSDNSFFTNDYFTTEITWDPDDRVFVNAVEYRAVFRMTAKEGYVFSALPAALPVGVEESLVEDDGKILSVTAVFPAVTTEIPAAAPILKVMQSLAAAAPSSGARPLTALSDTAYYTTEIVWTPADDVFREDTAYTAAFIMTAADGYVFEELPADLSAFPGQLRVSQSADRKTMVIQVSFPSIASGKEELTAFEKAVLEQLRDAAGCVSGELGKAISQLSSEALTPLMDLSGLGGLSGLSGLGALGSLGDLSMDMGDYSGLAAASAGTVYSSRQVVVCTISRMEEVKITIRVDEQDILSIEKGQKAELTLDALEGRTFEGTISAVADTAETTSGSAKFAVEITTPMDPDMRIGMTASADIAVGEARDVLLIPIQALQQTGDRTFVYTEQNPDSSLGGEREVGTGLSDGTDVQILSGLQEGETVYYEKESYNPFLAMRAAGEQSEI